MKNHLTENVRFLILFVLSFAISKIHAQSDIENKPNIILILADDFGLGDVQSYYPKNKVSTPNLNQLASQGLNFMDAHSGSAVCTPTRYGILTGRYAWRTRLQSEVLYPYAGPLVENDLHTIAEMLRSNGYSTGMIGKWHLGHNWVKKDDGKTFDYTAKLTGGATDHGFDYFFGPDVPNFQPYTFIENQSIYEQPTSVFPSDSIKWIKSGPIAPNYKFDRILPTITEKACDFVEGKNRKNEPFFLFFSMTSPHEPIVPSSKFKGSTDHIMFDFLSETDWSVGQIMKKLEDLGIVENTIVIFTADNGHNGYTYWNDVIELGHFPSGIYRSHKGQIYEGGHRVPFIVRWPNRIQPGTNEEHLISLNDIYATLAALMEHEIPNDQAPDSISFLSTLKGSSSKVRTSMVHHDAAGRFAMRHGDYKLVIRPPYKEDSKYEPLANNDSLRYELYDLKLDPSETMDISSKNPKRVIELEKLLQKQIDDGRSTDGKPLSNDRKISYRTIPETPLLKK